MIAIHRFRIEPNAVATLLVSHLHGDHFGGPIPAVRGADLLIAEDHTAERKVKFHPNWASLGRHLPAIASQRVLLTYMAPDMLARAPDGYEPTEDGIVVTLTWACRPAAPSVASRPAWICAKTAISSKIRHSRKTLPSRSSKWLAPKTLTGVWVAGP